MKESYSYLSIAAQHGRVIGWLQCGIVGAIAPQGQRNHAIAQRDKLLCFTLAPRSLPRRNWVLKV
jgi:hypothetical protein